MGDPLHLDLVDLRLLPQLKVQQDQVLRDQEKVAHQDQREAALLVLWMVSTEWTNWNKKCLFCGGYRGVRGVRSNPTKIFDPPPPRNRNLNSHGKIDVENQTRNQEFSSPAMPWTQRKTLPIWSLCQINTVWSKDNPSRVHSPTSGKLIQSRF